MGFPGASPTTATSNLYPIVTKLEGGDDLPWKDEERHSRLSRGTFGLGLSRQKVKKIKHRKSYSDVFREQTRIFNDKYVRTRQIFRDSKVWECVERSTGERFCVKYTGSSHEIEILQRVRSDFVVSMIDHYVEDGKVFFVMNLCDESMYSRVIRNGRLSEDETSKILHDVVSGVDYLHKKMIYHGDIQPFNILLDGNWKLTDFARANRTRQRSSTSIFVAPEKHISAAGDMWSVGMITLFCLSGQHEEIDQSEVLRAIQSGCLKASSGAKQFLNNLIHVDPETRLSCSEAKFHKFIKYKPKRNSVRFPECATW